jgi:excisionase family DNA binding protein
LHEPWGFATVFRTLVSSDARANATKADDPATSAWNSTSRRRTWSNGLVIKYPGAISEVKYMKPIHLQVSVTLDEEGAKTLVKLIRLAVTTEAGYTSHKDVHLNESYDASFTAKQPPDGNGFLIDSKQVSQLLRVSRTTVYEMRTQGRLPKPIQLGRAVRWNYEEIKQWVNAGCP